MGKMGKFDLKGLKDFQKQLEKLQNPDDFVEACAKELAQRLFSELIKNTPYITHKLRRGWTIGSVQKCDGGFMVEIVNPVEYASYVNSGHRQEVGRYVPAIGKKLKHKWVKGLFFVEKALGNVEKMSKPLLEKRLNEYLAKMFKG